MAVRLTLDTYLRVVADPLGRDWTGYFPRMTEQEAWESARGVRRMSRARASRHRFALVVGDGRVLAVAEVTGITSYGERHALEGQVLPAGHPVRDAYLGHVDPAPGDGRHPVTYCDLPEEQPFLTPCGCGCDGVSDRDYLPGHDVRAFQDRVRAHFHGSAKAMLAWVDAHLLVGCGAATIDVGTDSAATSAVDHVTSADHVGAGRPAGQRAVERPTRPSTSDTPTASTHPAAEFPVASPPIVLAVHEMIVTSWDRTAVRWASLQEAAARRGLALSTRHQVGTALAAVFGGGVDVGKAPDGTWGYPVTELWLATCTWLAGHGIDPLAIYATFASTAPCAVALPAALAVRDQCDLTNSRRLMEDLRQLGVAVPPRNCGQQRLLEVVRHHHDSASVWMA